MCRVLKGNLLDLFRNGGFNAISDIGFSSRVFLEWSISSRFIKLFEMIETILTVAKYFTPLRNVS